MHVSMSEYVTVFQAREPPGQEPQNLPPPFDPQHETERKRQLLKLYNRTPEQVTGL